MAISLPCYQGLLGRLEFVILFTSSGELILNFLRHRFAPKPGRILLLLHQLKDKFVALWQEEWRNLFLRHIVSLFVHFLSLFLFSVFSVGDVVALIAIADVLVCESRAASEYLRCHHLLGQYVTFDTSSKQS